MLITQTPLRISLAGGGTDLPVYYRRGGGAVLSSAIDKFVYVILNQRFDDQIYISYSKKEIVERVADIRHDLVREAMRKAGVERGIEIAIMADVPSEGCGLGSSSSLTVGLLNAFYAYRGLQAPAEQLAREACDIEIDRCGKPIGKQDQYIAAYGGLRFIEFQPDESVTVADLSRPRLRQDLGARLLLFFTNITRRADDILREQSDKAAERQAGLDGILDVARRLRAALLDGRLDEIGPALQENWRLKKELAGGVSNPAIDAMVRQAMAGGALGCKICGAGGGGFLMVYCPPDRQSALRRALSAYRELPFFLERHGSKVIFNAEGYEWK